MKKRSRVFWAYYTIILSPRERERERERKKNIYILGKLLIFPKHFQTTLKFGHFGDFPPPNSQLVRLWHSAMTLRELMIGSGGEV
jgi:hypothetical protein